MSVPMLQTLDLEGHATGPAPDVPAEDLVRLFRHMLMMRVLDQRRRWPVSMSVMWPRS